VVTVEVAMGAVVAVAAGRDVLVLAGVKGEV
jgi:hypothetical protein